MEGEALWKQLVEKGVWRAKMIQAILVFNNHGKLWLVCFYQRFPEEIQQQIIREIFHLVLKRDDNICNFLWGGSLIGGSDYKLIYQHYATLYFVFCGDSRVNLGSWTSSRILWRLWTSLSKMFVNWI